MNARTQARLLPAPTIAGNGALCLQDLFLIENPVVARKALDMAQLFAQAAGAAGRFDLEAAQALVAGRPGLLTTGVLDDTLEQPDAQAGAMLERVCARLEQFLGAPLQPGHQRRLGEAIEDGFAHLQRRATDAWIFYQRQAAYAVHCRYHVLFALRSPCAGALVYAAPLGVDIVARRDCRRALFMTYRDEASYQVRLRSIKVAAPFAVRLEAVPRGAQAGRSAHGLRGNL